MKFQTLICIIALCVNAASAFTSSSCRQRPRKALISSRKPTAIRAAAADGAAKKKKTVKKKKKAVKKKKAAPAAAKKEEAPPVETFRKPEFIASIAEKTGMSKADSEAALAAVLETITENVAAGKRISMLGFGTFKLTRRAARKGRNPKTGEEIQIQASNSPSFSAGKAFKAKCNPE